MSTQIAVRLPDDMVRQMDVAVVSGVFTSRTGLVEAAVECELRRVAAGEDARTIRSQGPEDDLDDLVAWTADHAETED